MKLRSLIFAVLLVCLAPVVRPYAEAAAQTAPAAAQTAADKPALAENVFKSVQVLRGISAEEFMNTMGFFSAALGMNCVDCHTPESVGNWARFAEDTPVKQTARRMIVMVKTINQANFGGERKVTCYSCHRGTNRPEITPSLAEQYGAPPPEDPDRIESSGDRPAAPSTEQILDRYIQATGGAAQLARLTSFTGKGTYSGYDTDTEEVPMDIFVKAPNLRTTIVHTRLGDNTFTYDGRAAWVASIDEPLPLFAMSGDELQGARIDAEIALPARIKQAFATWRAGFPDVTVDGRSLQVIEGTSPGSLGVKFFFDKETGLLARQVRYANTAVGLIPTHIEYSDYRTVAGVKIPFHWVVTWTHGQSTIKLSDVQPNAAIDAVRFAKPAPAKPPKPAGQ